MTRQFTLAVATALCAVALAACATASPAVVSATAQPIPATGSTHSAPAATAASPATLPAASAPAGSAALACQSGGSASVTPALTEGPFFKAGSPERASLLDANTAGTKLIITGTVYTAACQPVAHALLDFWQADANGAYDNSGYTLRGHQYTDAKGHYTLTTIVPGLYTGRTEHIHVKVQAPGGAVLTTQLFFPGVAQNDSDGIYNPALLLALQNGSGSEQAQYNFVVP